MALKETKATIDGTGTDSIKFGQSAVASGAYSIAIGYGTSATAEEAAALGKYAVAKLEATAVGAYANALGNYSIALGYLSNAPTDRSTAVGTYATASNEEATALGHCAEAAGNQATTLGYFANASKDGATALGAYANATGINSTAAGFKAVASGTTAIALGPETNASASSATALGQYAKASKSCALAIGYGAKASGVYAFAIGTYESTASANYTTAIDGYATADRAIAVGGNAVGANSLALGFASKASGINSIAIGKEANTAQNYSTALGYKANINTSHSVNCMMLGGSTQVNIYYYGTLRSQSDINDKIDVSEIPNGATELFKQLTPIEYYYNYRDEYIEPEEWLEEEIEIKDENGNIVYDEEGNSLKDIIRTCNLSKEEQEKRKKYGQGTYDKEAWQQGLKKHTDPQVGLSAQELLQALENIYGNSRAFPLVGDNFDNFELEEGEEIPEDIEHRYNIAYINLIPFLIKSIKELDARITELEREKGEN